MSESGIMTRSKARMILGRDDQPGGPTTSREDQPPQSERATEQSQQPTFPTPFGLGRGRALQSVLHGNDTDTVPGLQARQSLPEPSPVRTGTGRVARALEKAGEVNRKEREERMRKAAMELGRDAVAARIAGSAGAEHGSSTVPRADMVE